MIRAGIIRTKIAEILEGLELVKSHLPKSFDEFEPLGLVKDGIYKRVEFCIENVFDICAIIDTDLKLGVPSSDEDILEILVRNGIFAEDMAEKLRSMKGFRNVVVHRYGGIDDSLAYGFLSNNLGDFDEFIEKVTEFVDKQKDA